MTVRVGWLADKPGYTGGAERTQEEFRKAGMEREDVWTVDCPPGKVSKDCDVYAVHNCLSYSLNDLRRIEGKRVVRYWNDVGNWYPQEMRDWFAKHSTQICCSQLQAQHMSIENAELIPPSVDLSRFEQAAASVNGNRAGTISVAQWRAGNKGARAVAEWAARNGERVDFYGGGAFAPQGSREVAYQGMPALLAQYQRFVFLPQVIEPFGRLVVEAWAAGCEIVCNRLVGALEWIESNPDAIRTAADDYWKLLLA